MKNDKKNSRLEHHNEIEDPIQKLTERVSGTYATQVDNSEIPNQKAELKQGVETAKPGEPNGGNGTRKHPEDQITG